MWWWWQNKKSVMVQKQYRDGFWVECGRGLQTKMVFLKMPEPQINQD